MTNAAFRAALTLCLTLPVLAAPAARAQGDANLHREVALWLAALGPRGPGAPPASDIARLINDHPTWPERGALAYHFAQALSEIPTNGIMVFLCRNTQALDPASLPLCAEAEQAAGHKPEATALAQRAYIEGTADEQSLLKNFPAAIGPTQHWARFQRLAWSSSSAAARVVPHLTGDAQKAAAAWVLLRHDDAKAADALAELPAASPYRNDPLIRYEEARAARREGALRDAAALWAGPTTQAEAATTDDLRKRFFTERDILARQLLDSGDFANADLVATDPLNTTATATENEALRGLIAWDHGDLPQAAAHFARMAQLFPGVVTQARADWWQAQVAKKQGNATGARDFLTKSAAYPTNFYGQAAIAELGQTDQLPAKLAALRDPAVDSATAAKFERNELLAVATILAGLDERHHAALFLEKAAQDTGNEPAFTFFASRARTLDVPEAAVQIARFAGRIGVLLPQTGWPEPYTPPPGNVSTALALGIMRQESSFNPMVQSPAGAIGLMQLLPATAAEIAKKLHVDFEEDMLSDPASNMTLGCAYLGELIDKFGSMLPYAIAAYNGGPHRVHEWLQDSKYPVKDWPSMMIWIEHIPVEETRSYVTHVLESTVVYGKGTLPKFGFEGTPKK